MTPWPQQPYVGASAFAHKAGYHTDGVIKVEYAYQHIDPALVGNQRRLLVSELGGSRGLLDKLTDLGIDYPLTPRRRPRADREGQGDGGARLPVRGRRRLAGAAGAPQPARLHSPPFNLDDFWVVERRSDRAEDRRPAQGDAGGGDGQAARLRPRRRRGPRHPDRRGRQRPRQRPRRRGAQGAGRVLPRRSTSIRLVDYKVRIIDSTAPAPAPPCAS